ncbi:hypothetical protein ACL02P_03435 [Paenibacillus sp. MB22_1]
MMHRQELSYTKSTYTFTQPC